MPDIISRCPHCKVTFQVTQNQLKTAEGMVRCSVCRTGFDAVEHQNKESTVLESLDLLASVIDLKEEEIRFSDDVDFDALLAEIEHLTKPETLAAPVTEPEKSLPVGWDMPGVDLSMQPESASRSEDESAAPVLPGVDLLLRPDTAFLSTVKTRRQEDAEPESVKVKNQLRVQPKDKALQEEPTAGDPGRIPLGETTFGLPGGTAEMPVFIVKSKSTGKGKWRYPILLIVILIGLALSGQYLYFHIDRLPSNLMHHRLLKSFCRLAGCMIPKQTDVSLIQSRQLIISSDPTREGELLVNIVLVNQADFAQPYPTLELEFRDINDRLVARRRFGPSDYLKGEMAGAVLMPPGQPVRIELELSDPGEEAVNYSLFIRKY